VDKLIIEFTYDPFEELKLSDDGKSKNDKDKKKKKH
jgi:hypothetical protein